MSGSLSPLPIVVAFTSLERFDEKSDLQSILDKDFREFSLSVGLRKQLKRWDKLIYETLRAHSGSNQFMQFSLLGARLFNEGKLTLLKRKAGELLQSDSKLKTQMQEFETNLAQATSSTLRNLRPAFSFGLGAAFIPYQRGFHTDKKPPKAPEPHPLEDKYRKEFCSLTVPNRSKELKAEFLKIEIENIPIVAKVLTTEQANELISASLNDDLMANRLAYLIVSLPHDIIEEILHLLPNQALILLNKILFRTSLEEEKKEQTSNPSSKSIPSFETMFVEFREGFVQKSNAMRNQIDELDRMFRTLKSSDITKQHTKQMDDLYSEIVHRVNGIRKLETLIKGLGNVSTRLSAKEFPHEYNTCLARLSEDESVIEKTAGNPWGYIYDNAFKDAGVTNEDSVSKLFPIWGIDPSLEEKIKEKGIFSILDLKVRRVFNKRMLFEELGIDESVSNKVQEV